MKDHNVGISNKRNICLNNFIKNYEDDRNLIKLFMLIDECNNNFDV